jgi:hypothetical protein
LLVSFSPEKNVVFEWHKTRGTKALETTLEGFKGTVQCDGYIAYKTYAKDCDDIALAGCWAHARRKFHEAATESPKQAAWFIHQIGLLYCIERRLRSAKSAPVIRSAVRSSQSAYILRRIKKALLLKFPKHLPKGLMGKAIAYCLNHWEQLCVFVENGVVEIDNNLVENFIRPSAVGKRNWLFIGHADAGNRAAVIYSILGTCRRLGINQAEYLREVFERLPAMKISEVSALTPLNWAKEKGRRSVKRKVVLNSNPSP